MARINKNKPHRLTITFFLGLFFLLGIIQPFYSLSKILLLGELIDFGVYYRAAKGVSLGLNPYLTLENLIPFNYPPASLFFFIPFSLLPLFSGQIVWTSFSLTCLGLSIYLLLKCLNLRLKLGEFFLLIPLVSLAFPVKWTLGMGQINNLIFLLLVAIFYFYQKRQDFLSGVSLGLAVILKLTPLFLLGLFLLKRKWKIVFYSLATILFFTFLAGLVFGFDLTVNYFFKILPSLFGGTGKEIYYNQSISGLLARLIADNNLGFYFSSFFSFLILGISYWVLARRKKLTSLDYSLLIIAILLVNRFSWQHHFVWTIFPFLALLAFLRKEKSNYGLWLLLVSYFLIAFNLKNPALFQGAFFEPLILSHVLFGTLILYGLLFYFLIHEAQLRK